MDSMGASFECEIASPWSVSVGVSESQRQLWMGTTLRSVAVKEGDVPQGTELRFDCV